MIDTKFKYRNREWLKEKLGKEVLFYGFEDMPVIKGIITFDNNKYWLPFCGHVNAETVKIYEV